MKRKNKGIVRSHEWADFESIIYRIESNPHISSSRRIENLIELIGRLGSGPLSIAKKAEILSELRRGLSRYQWVRRIEHTKDGWCSITMPRFEELSPDEVWEYGAVNDLLELTEHPDGLSRIRRCEIKHCNRWFFASARKDQRFCSGKCRQYDYDNDEDRKEKKRLAMRAARVSEKERVERENSRIGFPRKRTSR